MIINDIMHILNDILMLKKEGIKKDSFYIATKLSLIIRLI